MLNREATNTNSIFSGLTPSGLEPTIYHTQGQYANHYTIVVVVKVEAIYTQLIETTNTVPVCMLSVISTTPNIPTDQTDP